MYDMISFRFASIKQFEHEWPRSPYNHSKHFRFCSGRSMNSMKLVILLHLITLKKTNLLILAESAFTKCDIFGKIHFLLISENQF